VENPSAGFKKLRDKTDARVMYELGYFEHLQCDTPDWHALNCALKFSRTQLRHLHSSVVRRVVKSLHLLQTSAASANGGHGGAHGGSVVPDDGTLCEVEGVTYCAGDFAIVRGADKKQLIAQLLGINPATKMLRVRWIYRWHDLAPTAISQASSKWRHLLTGGVRKKTQKALQVKGEVFFVFHEDFIHHQALTDKCSVRFMCPEGSAAAAEQMLRSAAAAEQVLKSLALLVQK
jgi:hypothetical protein